MGAWIVPEKIKSDKIVITVSGSEGGMASAMTSVALANQGIPSLSVAYFGLPGLPASLERIPLEYFSKVLDFLRNQSAVSSEQIIMFGPSRGSELSLLVASKYHQITGVIAMVPSGMVWGANSETENASAWTWQGQDVSFMRTLGNLDETLDYYGNKAWSNRGAFVRGLAATPLSQRTYIAVEKINGPVLLIGGEDDQLWPSCDFGKTTYERLREKFHPFKDRFICFENAGHDILIPGLSTYQRSFLHPHMNMKLSMGGTPQAMGVANRGAWNMILDFLR